jgi:DNA topoisomerase-3
LIDTIPNELLKSAELTGDWEKKLRLIEKQQYDYEHFKDELKQMVMDLTNEIMSPKAYKLEKAVRDMGNTLCPKCKTGHVIKGNSAYGCTRYTDGCTFRLPLVIEGAELTEPQMQQLIVSKSVSFSAQEGGFRFEMTEGFEVKSIVNQ